ncbi:MAG: hypothetical protein GY733_22895, partial [bacterium]|nr:hypothetical protein [bacterium]
SPVQRERVALGVGSKWAWERIEKTFLADGKLSDNERMVGRIFERMGSADPRELRELARSIRQGETAGVKDALVETLGEVLEETAAADEIESLVAALPQPEPESEPLAVPEASESLPARLVSDTPEVMASTHAAQSRATPEPRRPRFPVRERIRLDPRPTPSPEPPAPPPHAAERIEQPEFPATTASEFNGADYLRVLRCLERDPAPGASDGAAGRSALLVSLGGGWASRRALSCMIRARTLDDLDEALQLTRQLARPGQRLWCLADLLEHWELADGQVDRILEQAPTDAARRRLSHRVAPP